MSVTYISVAQLRTYEADPSQNAAGSGNSYTVVDTAQNLESLSQSDINEMPSIGATAIAASDAPAVMSANQVTLLVNNNVAITVPPNLTPQNSNDGTTDLPNPNGMSVDITWDPSVASAPASFEATIEQGVAILERTILNKFTFNIDVGYAEAGDGVNSGVGGGALPSNTSAAGDSAQQAYNLSYSQLLTDLSEGELSQSATSSAQLTSVNDLPNTTSLNGQSNFNIGSAEAKALTADDPTLNLISPTASAIDGGAGFGNGFSGNVLIGAVLHEFTHAMGRVPGTTALSLFQYLSNSTGTPQHDFNSGNPSTTNPAPASYFSIDGGVTTLAQFGTTSDQSDFLNSPASSLTPNDPFDETIAGSGQLTPQDLVMLNVLGFQINPIESFTSSYIQALNLNGMLLMLSAGVTTIDGGSLPQVTGTAVEIQSLTPQQITAIGDLGIGVTSLLGDGSIQLNIAQVEALEAANIGVAVPSGDTVTLNDTASHIEALTVSEIDALAGIGVNIIHATDGSVVLSLAQALALEGTPLFVTVPGGDTVAVADTAANIEALTLSEIAGLPAIGISGIKVTDTSVTITIDQATALEAAFLSLKVPSGATVTIFDETEGGLIERLTPAQIEALPSISATVLTINVNDLPLGINVADAVAIESVGATVVFPDPTSLNFTYVYDTGANLGLLTPAEIAALPAAGFRALWASDPSDYPSGLPLTVAQAVALEKASLLVRGPSVFTPVIDLVDSAANLETLTAVQILRLPPISRGQDTFNLLESGPIDVTSTAQPLGFSVAQLDAFLQTGLQFVFSVEGGGAVTISDTAENISLFLLLHTQAQLNELKGDGFTGVMATDMSLQLSVADAVKLESAGLTASAPRGDAVTILDIGPDIETLTAQQISLLPTIGVTGISSFSSVQLNVAQAVALEQASLVVTAPAGDTVTVDDTIANLETLTPGELSGLTGIGVTGLGVVDTAGNIEALTPAEIATLKSEGLTAITATDASVELTVSQAVALEDPVYVTAPAGDSVILADTASNILGLNASEAAGLGSIGITAIAIVDTAGDIEALTVDQIAALGSENLTKITATDASVEFSVAEAVALEDASIVVAAPPGDSVAIADTAADIETLTPTELGALHSIGITAITATDASVGFTVAQAEAIVQGADMFISVPSGDTVTISDTAANIEALLAQGAPEIGLLVQFAGVTDLVATDTSVTLNVAEAETLEPPNLGTILPVSVPAGDSVTLADTAANIAAMSPQQLSDLTSMGVTAVTVTDQSITLTVAQALALYDPVPISVPPGDSVIIADTTADIEALTPTEIAGLAAIGVNTIDVSGLSGGESLTINGGITLSVDGAVPSGDTITFTGTGGVLALSQDVAGTDVAGTIYGFSPPDTIDLTDVPYDASGNGSASLATDPNDNQPCIAVTENSNTYYLDIDPNQVFLTAATFNLNPDGGGTGSGTDLTVVEPPVTYESLQVYYGQTADGVVIGSGGTVEAEFGATVNRAVVQGGGVLLGDDGSTINDTVIDPEGLLDLATGAAGSGTIDFDPAAGVPPGGTLEIDDTTELNATITGFAAGDSIDLTAIPDDPNGSANLVAGNVLDVIENGSTYTLQFDPTQDFSGEYFHLAPDLANTGTAITESSAPCYCPGTLILTDRGEVPVEALAIGDTVMTSSGALRPIKWIGRRSYGGRFVLGRKDILPICIKAGALDENVPRRDLWISPHHAMYLDGVLIEAKDLVNGVSIIQAERVEKVEYFHIELESHDVIIAEGALSEAFLDDDSRGMFHNAHEYAALYADTPVGPTRYCAPRLDEGYEVETARRRIEMRAGLRPIVEPERLALRGYVDMVSSARIAGWAQCAEHPEAPVCLDVYAGAQLIGQTLANCYREDLERAGLGSGRHSFEFTPPAGSAFASHVIEVRRSLDGTLLGKSHAAAH